MCFVALEYQSGMPPVDSDIEARIQWLEEALGDWAWAGHELLAIYEPKYFTHYNPRKARAINARIGILRQGKADH